MSDWFCPMEICPFEREHEAMDISVNEHSRWSLRTPSFRRDLSSLHIKCSTHRSVVLFAVLLSVFCPLADPPLANIHQGNLFKIKLFTGFFRPALAVNRNDDAPTRSLSPGDSRTHSRIEESLFEGHLVNINILPVIITIEFLSASWNRISGLFVNKVIEKKASSYCPIGEPPAANSRSKMHPSNSVPNHHWG